jgi:hypothetical protein
VSEGPTVEPARNALNEKVKTYADEAAARIAAADAESHDAQVAFAAGKFPEYFKKRLEEARERIDDEYARASEPRPAAAGGDGEEGG